MTDTLTSIIVFISNTVYIIFVAFDSVYIDYPTNSISFLDALIAIIFLKIIIWFVLELLGKNTDVGEEE